MAPAIAYPRQPNQALVPVYETRPATVTDINKLAYHLSQPTMDEIEARSKYAHRTFLIADLPRKRVIVDWTSPSQPIAIIDLEPVEGWDEANIWIGWRG